MRFAVLVSGSGTNLQSLIDADKRGSLSPAVIALVVSNRPQAKALSRASDAQIPTQIIDHKDFSERSEFDCALIDCLREHKIEAVVLAGFMRILGHAFVNTFPQRILNTHPALCPAFPGMAAAQKAIDAGVLVTGCTVHLVDHGVDTGPILMQEPVRVQPDDTAQSLQRRIQEVEHRLLPQATRALASGRVRKIHGRLGIH